MFFRDGFSVYVTLTGKGNHKYAADKNAPLYFVNPAENIRYLKDKTVFDSEAARKARTEEEYADHRG